jgi:uncharacterized repeat protein (TIGR03803 family)
MGIFPPRRCTRRFILILAMALSRIGSTSALAEPSPVTTVGSLGLNWQATTNPIKASDGNIYGSADNHNYDAAASVIYRISQSGSFSVLYTFPGFGGASELFQAPDHNFYGVTRNGGGWGTIFRLTMDGTFSSLHNFTNGDDGANPGNLVQGADGNFYGFADTNAYAPGPPIMFFRLEADGSITQLYVFTGGVYVPKLFTGADGNFYGVASSSFSTFVFKLTPQGSESVLFNDTNSGDYLDLTQGSDGNLYGALSNAFGGSPSFFRLSTQGLFKTLHTFPHNPLFSSYDSIVQASDGDLYIVDSAADQDNHVITTIYQVTPAGQAAILYMLKATDGDYGGQFVSGDAIYSGLVNGADGNLYTIGQFYWQNAILRVASRVKAPVAVSDIAVIRGPAPINIPVLNNDVSSQSAPLSIIHVSQPNIGTVTVNAGRTITYTPSPFLNFGLFPLQALFTYTVGDTRGHRSTAIVRVQNPFYDRMGNYSADVPGTGFSINLSVASDGRVSGQANYLGTVTRFSGEFDASGQFDGFASDGSGSGTTFSLRTDVTQPLGIQNPPIYCNIGTVALMSRVH